MAEPRRILVAVDSDSDFADIGRTVRAAYGPAVEIERSTGESAPLSADNAGGFDVSLLGGEQLDRLSGRAAGHSGGLARHPVILLAEDSDQVARGEALGIADHLLLSELSAPLLRRVVRYATEQRRIEMEISRLSQYDPVTGLANRDLFVSQLNDAAAQARRTKTLLAVMILDLDCFKDINDTFGHSIGDQVLKQTARRLKKVSRETDIAGRLDGDEFALIAPNLTFPNGATRFAERVLETFAEPFEALGRRIKATASVGITLHPLDEGSPEELLRHAGIALGHAKKEGGRNLQFYDSEVNQKRLEEKAISADLPIALSNDQFRLHYQPKVLTTTGTVVGVEALIRWQHPNRGILAPNQFIPVAEATGFIDNIGEWVLREACRQSASWRNQGSADVPIAVNLSAAQLSRPDLYEVVRRTIAESGIAPQSLELEITESMIMDQTPVAMENLLKLSDLGVRLAIDDFGTGYSSLAYLRRYPVDRLKIDRSFIRRIAEDEDTAAIAKAIVSLGKTLNLDITAEGVESEGQFAMLHELGCDEVQGYLFSRPLPSGEFAEWYERHSALAAKDRRRA